MSTQNFKIKNGLSIGENEIIDSQGNLTLPEGASIQVGGAPLDALPDQANNSGKYLTTDGSGASWETITQYTPPTNQGAGNFLSGDGTYKTVTVPTAVSQLTNDSGYQTSSQVANTVASLVDSAPTTLDTLNELAAALGDDPNFATTVATNIGNVSSNVNTHIANTSNPHSVTQTQVGLSNVENKSSATIRSEITSSNVTTALGFTPLSNTETAADSDKLDGQHGSYYQPSATAITTSNIGSQSVNYATSAGSASSATNADTLDGLHSSSFLQTGADISNITTIRSINFRAANAYYLGENNEYLSRINGGWYSNVRIQSDVDMRAPIFYDSDNTGYYADFSSTGTSINTAGDIVSNSDSRLKENVEPITDALNKVRALNGVTFNKIGETDRKTGVIAQDVEAVLPEAVTQQGEFKSVAYGNMVGLLIEAIKEQQMQIEILNQEIINMRGDW